MPRRYLAAGHLEHGYARTTYGVQGSTHDVARYHPTDVSSFEEGYVAITRARTAARIYVVDGTLPGPDLELTHAPAEPQAFGMNEVAQALARRRSGHMAADAAANLTAVAATLDGKTLAEAFPDHPLRSAMQSAGAAPGEIKEVDLSNDTERRFIRALASPVMLPGRVGDFGTVFSLRDVTLEKELDKMKEDFLHYITHDLRNPLGSAIGFLDILLKGTTGVLNAEQQSIVSSVRRSTSRLMGLINNILDIAKMEAGRVRVQIKPTSLAGIAGRSIEILEQLAKVKNITVELAAAEEFTSDVDGDMLERVFTNLLGNAIKYTPTGGKITVSVVDTGPALKCCVEDSGEGIPEEYLTRVFEKFEQVQNQRKGGTGLGLTIARFFVEAHLGRIWAESTVGQGSRFYFTVPKGLVADPDGGVHIGAEAK